MIFLLRSRHDVGGRRKKKRPTQLCTTQLYKNIQTSKFHTDYFITSFCIIASLRSHLATIASVEFSWFGTKTYPIPTHLVASHHETLQSPTNLRTCRIGWGEPKAKRKHCTRTPCVSGRESHPLFSNTHTRTHTSSNASDHESAGVTPHWRHCVSAFFIAVDVNVCVCEWSSHARWWKIFNFKMATDVFSQLFCLDRRETFRMRRFEGEFRSLALIARNSYISRSRVCVPYSKKKT